MPYISLSDDFVNQCSSTEGNSIKPPSYFELDR